MNLSESVKFVLKNRGPSLLQGFIHQDVKSTFECLKNDLKKFLQEKADRPTLGSIKSSTIGTVQVMKEIPGRVKRGFSIFRENFMQELDGITDPADKAVFCMKVIGALSSFAAGIVYDIRKTGSKIHLGGIGKKTALTEFLVAELVVRLSQLFVLRFIREIEKNVSDEEDLSNLRYFRQMISGRDEANMEEWKTDDPQDRAFQLVDGFRNYIMTGKS